MGEKDLTENYLEAYNDVFADIINVLLCDGKQIILQEHLEADGNKTIYKADKKVHDSQVLEIRVYQDSVAWTGESDGCSPIHAT